MYRYYFKATVCAILISSLGVSGSAIANTTDSGISVETAPYPWTNPVSKPNGYTVWGRFIDTGTGILPRQITSNRTNILASPLKIKLKLKGGSDLSLRFTRTTESTEGTTLKRTGTYQNKFFSARLHSEIDYDGLNTYRLELNTDNQTVEIEHLSIRLPIVPSLAKQYSKFLNYDFTSQKAISASIDDTSGIVDRSHNWHFNPAIWIGNSTAGIEWIHETNIIFSLKKPQNTHNIDVTDTSIALTTNIIDHPTLVTNQFNYTFALLATPSKPYQTRWRDYTVSSTLPAANSSDHITCCRNTIYMGHWRRTPLQMPGLPGPSSNPEEAIKYKNHRDLLRNAKTKYIPYSSIYILPSTLPDIIENKEWHSAPARKGSVFWTERINSRRPIQPISYESDSLREFVIKNHLTAIKEHKIDGIYFDVATMRELSYSRKRFFSKSRIRQHKYSVYYPVFSHRLFVKRYWEATKSINPDHIIIHHSAYLPQFSNTFVDIAAFGEPLHRYFAEGKYRNRIKHSSDGPEIIGRNPEIYQPNYFTLNSKELQSSRFSGNGTTYLLLPQVVRFNNDYLKKNPALYSKWTRSVVASAFLNDYLIWNTKADRQTLKHHNNVLNSFGKLSKAQHFTTPDSPTGLQVAGYQLENKFLIMIANTTKNSIILNTPLRTLLPHNQKITSIINTDTNATVKVDNESHQIDGYDYILLTLDTIPVP